VIGLQSIENAAEDQDVTTSFKKVGATTVGHRDTLVVVIVPGEPWCWFDGFKMGVEDEDGIVTWDDGTQTDSTDAMAEVAQDYVDFQRLR
jgi:hypothetical protein